jgi:HNH endonuclease
MLPYFEERTTKQENECITWNLLRNKRGYGICTYKNTRWYTHRLSFKLHNGELVPGMHICHTCDNPSCVNPKHLFQGTAKDNEADKITKNRNVRGTNSHYAKLTLQQINLILKLKGTASARYVGSLFGVSQQTVSRIWRGVTYKDELKSLVNIL